MDNYIHEVGYLPITIDHLSPTPYVQYGMYRNPSDNTADQPAQPSMEFPEGTSNDTFVGIAFRISFMFTDLPMGVTSLTAADLSNLMEPFITFPGTTSHISIGWETDSDLYSFIKAGDQRKAITINSPYTLYTQVYTRESLNNLTTGPMQFSLGPVISDDSYTGLKLGILSVDALLRKGGS